MRNIKINVDMMILVSADIFRRSLLHSHSVLATCVATMPTIRTGDRMRRPRGKRRLTTAAEDYLLASTTFLHSPLRRIREMRFEENS